MIRLIWGITPEHITLRTKTSPYAPSETTPSWIRAPPESLIPMTGQPILAARSMILHIFSPMTSPSEPPKTVKSWEKTQTRRPSIVPWPMTTASPQGRVLSMSNSCVRWRTNVSSSWNDPGSSSFSIRSRAVYFPRACCFSSASGEECAACWRRVSSWASFSSNVSGLCCRGMRRPILWQPLLARERAVMRGAEAVEDVAEELLDRGRGHRVRVALGQRRGLGHRRLLLGLRLGDRSRRLDLGLGGRWRVGDLGPARAPEHPGEEPGALEQVGGRRRRQCGPRRRGLRLRRGLWLHCDRFGLRRRRRRRRGRLHFSGRRRQGDLRPPATGLDL